LVYKFQLKYVVFTKAGTAPVSMLLDTSSWVSRDSPAKLGIGPVSPVWVRVSDCRLVRAPMAVGMWEVLVHEYALMYRLVIA
jgi:hypothetical protein